MKINTAEFITSIGNIEKYHDYNLPEITFVGRSNVGKSSLINALTNHKKLAKTSSLAGRTRLVNMFLINSRFILVDLPGYGYAKAGKEEQKEWQGLIEGYLQKSRQIKMVFVLVDIRIKPTEQDKQMLNYLYYYNMPFKVVATKADKLSKTQIKNKLHNIALELGLGNADMFAVSAQTKYGLEEILQYINNFLNYDTLIPNTQLIQNINLERKINRDKKHLNKNELIQNKTNNKSNLKVKNKDLKNKSINTKNNKNISKKSIENTKNSKNNNIEKQSKQKQNKNKDSNENITKKVKKTPRYILKQRKGK